MPLLHQKSTPYDQSLINRKNTKATKQNIFWKNMRRENLSVEPNAKFGREKPLKNVVFAQKSMKC